MEYHFKMHKEDGGYWAECVELAGCVTQGDDLAELKKNMQEVLDLYLDEPEDSQVIFSLPRKRLLGRNIAKVTVDPQIALAMLVRTERIKNKLTQKEVASRLGVPLYSYQRLEHSETANPEWKTLVKLLRLFPRLDLSFAI